ncbi:hypothetical protein F5051DRAFT_373416 [Lentinula edodes]|nr:hypothetical protein F5051DRAFT_373416 [Lentinula edodes]
MRHCNRCRRKFYSEQSFHTHCCNRNDHPYCVSCRLPFRNIDDLHCHLYQYHDEDTSFSDSDCDSNEENSSNPCCHTCNRQFRSSASLYQHLAGSSRHNWCFVCSKDFSSPNALNQHSSSQVHRSRDIKCPLCSEQFKMASAIAQHIESGACHHAINRHTVTQAIHNLNLIPTISINRRITGNSESIPTSRAITTYSASECAYDGTAYECYLCDRTYNTLNALNAHLGSPAHDSKEFRCPKCQKQYSLISGLVQHIESEVCGVARFEGVREQMLELTSGHHFQRMLTM